MSNIKILIGCHKDTPRIKDSIFTPILLGSSYASNDLMEKFKDDFWDNTWDNIGYLHPYCAELSAIYWAWKNYSRLDEPDYIGLFHYRRFLNMSDRIPENDPWKCAFFDFDNNTLKRYGWTQDQLLSVCKKADLILPDKEQIMDPYDWVTPTNLETHYKHAHYPEDFDEAMSTIVELYPEYKEAVHRACSSNWGYFCNMFILRKELFFDYANWVFNILLRLKDKLLLDSNKYAGNNEHQRRVLGFLGERLFNIWIEFQQTEKKLSTVQLQRLIGYLQESDKNTFIKQYGRQFYDSIQISKEKNLEQEITYFFENRPKTADVSIIIPIYNVSSYLRDCLDSLVNQTFKNIEIICVENGSTDNSPEIVHEYRQCDDRVLIVQLLHNVGMPRARNIGIQAARGKYFAFVDSDDVCDCTMFEKLFRKAELLQAEIVTCGVWRFKDEIQNAYLHRPLEWYADSDKGLPLSERPQQLMEPAGWCKLFNADYVASLDYFEFRPDVALYEDVPCITNAFVQAKKIGTIPEALYYYRDRSDGNLTASMNRKHIDDFVSGDYHQRQILKKHGYVQEEVLSYIFEFRFLMVEYILSKLNKKDVPYFFKKVSLLFPEDHNLNRLFNFYPRRKIVYNLIRNKSPYLYLFLRAMRHFQKRSKTYIKKAFHITREGVYKTFGLGPFYVKWPKKSYVDETIGWYDNKCKELEWHNLQYHQNFSEQQELVRRGLLRIEELRGIIRFYQTDAERLKEELRQKSFLHYKDTKLLFQLNSESIRLQNEYQLSLEKIGQMYHQYELAVLESKQVNQQLAETRQQMQEEAHLLELKNNETYGFYRAVWNTGWVNIWKLYYNQHFSTIFSDIDRLKEGLDEESKKWISLICYRNFKLLPLQEDSDLFLYDHLRIYTKEEREGAAIPLDEKKIREKYCIPEEEYLEVPVFRFDCGLIYFPQKALNTLKGRDVIDGGAYWGDSALVLNEYQPCAIHAFEPFPDSYEKLKETISNNGLQDKVIPISYGLGNRFETRTLYTQGMESGSNFTGVIPTVTTETEKVSNLVAVTTIDQYAHENNLNVGLIKLDIEGSELAAIQGALEVIKRDRPLLAISIYHQPKDFLKIRPLIESLNLGYRFLIRKLSFHDLVSEVMLIGYIENEVNVGGD